MQESYFKARANAPIVVEEDDAEVDYDSDGYPIISERSKVIDPLPPVDHSAVSVVGRGHVRGRSGLQKVYIGRVGMAGLNI